LRTGATADRGGAADIADIWGRGGCAAVLVAEFLASEFLISEVLISEVLISEVLAMSRDICSWPALSCSILIFNCSICWPMLARSRAIDGTCAGSALGAAASGAALCAA
jgi:hypothetical protein